MGRSHVKGTDESECEKWFRVCVCVLQFLSRSLEDVDDEEWLMSVGNALGNKEQVLARYSNYSEEKGFLFKCLGVILRKSSHKQFVQSHLDMMFSTVKHASQIEREVRFYHLKRTGTSNSK